jgi:hypothetical protein
MRQIVKRRRIFSRQTLYTVCFFDKIHNITLYIDIFKKANTGFNMEPQTSGTFSPGKKDFFVNFRFKARPGGPAYITPLD